MENIINDGINHSSKYVDPKRPHYPCSDSPEEFKNSCYLMQTSQMLTTNGGDIKNTFELCRAAGQYKDTCFQSLGRDISGRSRSDPATSHANCMIGKDSNEQTNCMIGAVKDFISFFHSDKQAKELCALLADKSQNATCFAVVSSYYSTF
jgi:hypothetical protein